MADPAVDPVQVAWLAVFTAFCSSTQDIAVDAYRIEAAVDDAQGAMAAAYQIGYQVALICAGAGALHAAAGHGWQVSYLVMAVLGVVGVLTTLFIAEPRERMDRSAVADEPLVASFQRRAAGWPALFRNLAAWLIGAVVCPFVDFFQRMGLRVGIPILLLVMTYRLNYTTMGVAANTFYLDMGFTLDQIALVSKVYGIVMTMAGAVLAGALIRSMGIPKTMLLGGTLLCLANLLYAHMAAMPPDIAWLATVVSADNIANGIAGTSFIAYMSTLTSAKYTATQYALFGTLWSLPAKTIASQWGKIVDAWGYPPFFIYTALVGIPSLLLVVWLIRHEREQARVET